MKYFAQVNDQRYEIEVMNDGLVMVNGEERHVDFKSMGQHAIYSLLIDNQSFEAVVEHRDGKYSVLIFGDLYEIAVTDERTERLARAGMTATAPTGDVSIRSPMPGLIVDVPVAAGDEVSQGQTVVILESMKMENELKSPRDGVISRVEVEKGQSVEQNSVLVVIS